MPKFLHLQIPKPCHEDWNQMTPEARGRFCNSCQKSVTDFTQMSDAQLIAFFKKPKQSTCGRFTQEQLEKDILIPSKKIPWARYFFQITLPAFLFSLKSTAQIFKAKAPVEIAPTVFQETMGMIAREDTIAKESTRVDGSIKDEQGLPVHYATINIKGTQKNTMADSAGRFSFKDIKVPATLVFSSVGFISQEVRVVPGKEQLNIQMSHAIMGDVVTVGAVVKTKRKSKKEEVCAKPIPVAPTLSVYPNPIPSSTPLHLKWQNLEEGNYVIEVYDVSGALKQSQKLILEKDLKETALSINQLTGGNYFARLINEKTSKELSQQFIVQD